MRNLAGACRHGRFQQLRLCDIAPSKLFERYWQPDLRIKVLDAKQLLCAGVFQHKLHEQPERNALPMQEAVLFFER
ncbi:hypothetical protein SDC9_189618 [bioreactor metagenome]|uniref:Uncharacterized protein n=1 Tax=bioreactor metagenome TaxID=1076179 RepID=A0A645HUB3_9ZZZZ